MSLTGRCCSMALFTQDFCDKAVMLRDTIKGTPEQKLAIISVAHKIY